MLSMNTYLVSRLSNGFRLRVGLALFFFAVQACFGQSHVGRSRIETWRIEANDIDPKHYFGDTVANGQIGLVSSPEPFGVKQVLIDGAFDIPAAGEVSVIQRTFNFVKMGLSIDGVAVDSGSISNLRQVVDMKHALLSTRFDVGDKATVQYSWYALRELPFTALVDVSITAKRSIEIHPSSVMEAPRSLSGLQHFDHFEHDGNSSHDKIPLLTATGTTAGGRLLIAASNSFIFGEPAGGAPAVSFPVDPNGVHTMVFSKKLAPGTTYHFVMAGSTITSSHVADPKNEAERLTLYAVLEGRDRLVARHEEAWAELWKSDIVIEGDDETQRDVHSMLYHLYSFAQEGTSNGIAPMGLSGTGYSGHRFWDMETWMFPALLLLQPKMAESCLEYRIARLPAARRNAYDHGYKGAMFPWESAGSGDEDTPVFALTGPFEHHITADVGIAAWKYFCVTQDEKWLREKGWPLIKETADFWVSRVERNGPGHFDIKDVVPADEFATNVDNDAFTNAAAKENLEDACLAARVLGERAEPDWKVVHDNIPILRMANGVTREHSLYDGQPIKQADVNLLAYPLHEVRDPAAIRRDLEYYEGHLGNGPAMTRSIFSILFERLGEPEKALAEFKRGYKPNLRPPFGVMAEYADNNEVYFATAVGGLLQALLNGFGGLEITPQGLRQQRTRLPGSWKSIRLPRIGPESIHGL